jgi:hypothetical protein
MAKRLTKKPGRSVDPPLSDRERILMVVIDALSTTQTLARPGRFCWSSDEYKDTTGDRHYVHFAPWKEPAPGDLVLAQTGNISRWKVGWYVQKQSDGALIREIGSDKLCNYGNESFRPIVGLENDLRLLEGDRYQFLVKVYKAFARGDEYLYRFGGLRFDGEDAVITIREAFGGLGGPSQPFDARIRWDKRTSVAAILKAMRDAGYGTRDFRPKEESPALGERDEH